MNLEYSDHSAKRMMQRNVPVEEIEKAIMFGNLQDSKKQEGVIRFTYGNLKVVTTDDRRKVITAFWSTT